MHVAVSTIDRLLDYVIHTAPDGYNSAETVRTLTGLIERNQATLEPSGSLIRPTGS